MGIFYDEQGWMHPIWSLIGWLLAIIAGIAALIFGFFLLWLGAMTIDRNIAQNRCEQFAEESNRRTRFVVYGRSSWDCLTPSKGGKWISTYNLIQVERGER